MLTYVCMYSLYCKLSTVLPIKYEWMWIGHALYYLLIVCVM